MPTPLRYVILRHEGIDSPHFDLMFELTPGGLLATWRSDAWPIEQPTPLLRLGDHRRDYLTFEGPLTGNRGSVRRVEAGTFSRRISSPARIDVDLAAKGATRKIQLVLDASGEPHWTARVSQ
jgi:hypothetical protein